MYYVFILNNIEIGESFFKAEDIMKYMLQHKFWAFSRNAPNLKYITERDRVVVYLAGAGSRCIAADFSISSKPYAIDKKSDNPAWLSMFPMRVNIQNINEWDKRVPISELIPELNFIQDKKNYGLYFRQSTKSIGENDYNIILKK